MSVAHAEEFILKEVGQLRQKMNQGLSNDFRGLSDAVGQALASPVFADHRLQCDRSEREMGLGL